MRPVHNPAFATDSRLFECRVPELCTPMTTIFHVVPPARPYLDGYIEFNHFTGDVVVADVRGNLRLFTINISQLPQQMLTWDFFNNVLSIMYSCPAIYKIDEFGYLHESQEFCVRLCDVVTGPHIDYDFHFFSMQNKDGELVLIDKDRKVLMFVYDFHKEYLSRKSPSFTQFLA